MILRQGLTLALAGIALGTAGAAALTRVMGDLLFGVSPTDPLTFVGASALFRLHPRRHTCPRGAPPEWIR
jgi:hypothetical protein